MRTISCKLEDLKTMTLHIGYEGENDYTSVRIDAGSVFAQYPDAVPSMKVQPPKGNMYPVIVTRDGDIVIWNVSDSDTASNGNGEIQLTFTENTVVVKSCTGKTLVHRSLKATGPAPDPLIDFIDRAEEVVGEAEEAAEAAEAAAQHAPMIGLDGYWYKWDAETEGYVKTDTKARGEDGANGVGITSVEKISTVGLVDTYRINFTNGTNTTYTVTNGQDGSVPIDDTTPAANKVFSSAKVDEELTGVKNAIQGKPDIKSSNKTGVDLDLSDPDGNVILRLKDGHIQTKEFNSAAMPVNSNGSGATADLDFSDINGNVILRLKDGHIITKKYNSEHIRQLMGKKWVVIGDSLTEHNQRATKNYHDYVAEETGITVVNLGRSGRGYAREADGMSYMGIVPSIPEDADIITIFGSGNDNSSGLNLGTATDSTTETICGCINITLDSIFEAFPLVPIGVITPTPWKNSEPSDGVTNMSNYCEKLVEICALRGIPCLDLYHCSNLHPDDADFRSEAYSKDGDDGVHPDENGHKIIAPRFRQFVFSLI